METGPVKKSADYESHYAIGGGARTRHDGANLNRSMVEIQVRLSGEGGSRVFSAGNILSSEQAGIDRPRAWADHGQSTAEDGKKDCGEGVAGSRQRDPHFDNGDERSRNRRPQASQNEYPQESSNGFRDQKTGSRWGRHLPDPVIEQSEPRYESLQEKAEAGPAIRESREKTLQGALKSEGTARATVREALKAGTRIILLGESEFDNSPPEADGYSVGSIAGAELRQDVGHAALDRRFRNRKHIGDLLVGVPGGDQLQYLNFAAA